MLFTLLMKPLFTLLILIFSITSCQLQANANLRTPKAEQHKIDEATLHYFERSNIKRNGVSIVDTSLQEVRPVEELSSWQALFVHLSVTYQGSIYEGTELVFRNGDIFTSDLYSASLNKEFSKVMKPQVLDSLYQEDHRLYGSPESNHTVVIFSDPLCIFCQENVPKILNYAKTHPNALSIFYYTFPLQVEDSFSQFTAQLLFQAIQDKRPDIVGKLYALQISSEAVFTSKIKPKSLVTQLAEKFYYHTTPAKVRSQKNRETLHQDINLAKSMMVKTTPTIFVDGEWDRGLEKIMELITQ